RPAETIHGVATGPSQRHSPRSVATHALAAKSEQALAPARIGSSSPRGPCHEGRISHDARTSRPATNVPTAMATTQAGHATRPADGAPRTTSISTTEIGRAHV